MTQNSNMSCGDEVTRLRQEATTALAEAKAAGHVVDTLLLAIVTDPLLCDVLTQFATRDNRSAAAADLYVSALFRSSVSDLPRVALEVLRRDPAYRMLRKAVSAAYSLVEWGDTDLPALYSWIDARIPQSLPVDARQYWRDGLEALVAHPEFKAVDRSCQTCSNAV